MTAQQASRNTMNRITPAGSEESILVGVARPVAERVVVVAERIKAATRSVQPAASPSATHR